ncbi:disulfide oxidoreductase [Alkalihalophilus marmarensis]|uniref:Probable disulfide formation protein n=1 Tax=Alkalihalophilus marmarensis DSM 21297 TaxID=1188261 RepID=U6ST33_9BACI|nr:disulfide oxidoreductase [Alkalihalophilus marmarensis]ERN54527.1 dihydroneopterin aldolase [Alkalihalophilus marmarensis DSM 21297]MCM3490509.1 disulfide oxidoreductase [Alkalihalophilus marmarensis]
MAKKIENILIVAWLTSFTAMLGSLYFSVVRQFEPCSLCWYQRILMYPIVIILLIGIIRRDTTAAIYSFVFSIIGILVSSYHYANQKLPFLQDAVPSCGRVPCSGQYINWFGFVTIPFLALTAFTIIAVCSLIIIRNTKERE